MYSICGEFNYINVETDLVEHVLYFFRFWPSVLVPGMVNSSGTLDSPRSYLRYFVVFQIKILSIAAFLSGQSLTCRAQPKLRASGFVEFDTLIFDSIYNFSL